MSAALKAVLGSADVETLRPPPDVRISKRGSFTIIENWGANNVNVSDINNSTSDVTSLERAGVLATRKEREQY